ncbi:winged helix-turn-helix transcriptional regulator [Nocardioides antri]|uniref:Helix-turn-helix transcriptional regulator n=1 Tax=Nocardioides antri TaxID=2607659 RepID=A0A5B1LXR4_9ACTN|nr:helix-turn-helix domain-containing protein [Nocardioides antri]KAA1424230.1 helix-turn-helix transcriptional regulator [Nocardioides antri]
MSVAAEPRECSIARTLELVGERWTLLVIRELMVGSRRFEEIARYTGAPRDVLTARLRKLEADGLVERRPYQQRPPRLDYHLTPLGWSLLPVITVLREWGDDHLAGADGPPLVLRHTCGATLRAVVCCSACGEEVRARDLAPVG